MCRFVHQNMSCILMCSGLQGMCFTQFGFARSDQWAGTILTGLLQVPAGDVPTTAVLVVAAISVKKQVRWFDERLNWWCLCCWPVQVCVPVYSGSQMSRNISVWSFPVFVFSLLLGTTNKFKLFHCSPFWVHRPSLPAVPQDAPSIFLSVSVKSSSLH